VDANGYRSCSQYDGLGRLVEAAAPGDTLSAQIQCAASSAPANCFVRDTANCPASGSSIGNGGAGPTSWTEYHAYGLNGVGYNHAYTEVHTKDGTATGKYAKTFTDGLGRTTESCNNIDPTTTAGAGTNNEACSYTAYDSMGHIYQSFSPYFGTSVALAT